VKLEHAFDVPASPDETLALLLDVERVVPCMPGATLKEVVARSLPMPP
jgi:carbon monoxide dehydrogenase subunit G